MLKFWSMQSIGARGEYRNTFHCASRILTEEGLLVFWSGAVPRLGRLMVHNSHKDAIINLIDYRIDKRRPGLYFLWESNGIFQQGRSWEEVFLMKQCFSPLLHFTAPSENVSIFSEIKWQIKECWVCNYFYTVIWNALLTQNINVDDGAFTEVVAVTGPSLWQPPGHPQLLNKMHIKDNI